MRPLQRSHSCRCKRVEQDVLPLAGGAYDAPAPRGLPAGVPDDEALLRMLRIYQPHFVSPVIERYVRHPGIAAALGRIVRRTCPGVAGRGGEMHAVPAPPGIASAPTTSSTPRPACCSHAIPAGDPAVKATKRWLEGQGHRVDEQVGSSRFRIDLGVRSADEGSYRLGLLLNTAGHYQHAQQDPSEAYLQRPAILESFGWGLYRILARDLLEDRERVQAEIQRLLE